jgi:hypothetical protein
VAQKIFSLASEYASRLSGGDAGPEAFEIRASFLEILGKRAVDLVSGGDVQIGEDSVLMIPVYDL